MKKKTFTMTYIMNKAISKQKEKNEKTEDPHCESCHSQKSSVQKSTCKDNFNICLNPVYVHRLKGDIIFSERIEFEEFLPVFSLYNQFKIVKQLIFNQNLRIYTHEVYSLKDYPFSLCDFVCERLKKLGTADAKELAITIQNYCQRTGHFFESFPLRPEEEYSNFQNELEDLISSHNMKPMIILRYNEDTVGEGIQLTGLSYNEVILEIIMGNRTCIQKNLRADVIPNFTFIKNSNYFKFFKKIIEFRSNEFPEARIEFSLLLETGKYIDVEADTIIRGFNSKEKKEIVKVLIVNIKEGMEGLKKVVIGDKRKKELPQDWNELIHFYYNNRKKVKIDDAKDHLRCKFKRKETS